MHYTVFFLKLWSWKYERFPPTTFILRQTKSCNEAHGLKTSVRRPLSTGPVFICLFVQHVFLPSSFAISGWRADLFEESHLDERQITSAALIQDVQISMLVALYSKQMLEVWTRSFLPRLPSVTRWQYVSAAAGYLAGCPDRRVWCQLLCDPVLDSSSDSLKDFYTVTVCQSLDPLEATAFTQ